VTVLSKLGVAGVASFALLLLGCTGKGAATAADFIAESACIADHFPDLLAAEQTSTLAFVAEVTRTAIACRVPEEAIVRDLFAHQKAAYRRASALPPPAAPSASAGR
jgi:hypothetical protein